MNTKKIKCSLLCLAAILLTPICASADVVWPSLYILEGMTCWYVILAGLLIEIVFIKLFLKETYLKSALIGVAMNGISTVIGLVAVPLSGLFAEVLMIPFGTGTFHISHWIVSYLFAIAINVVIEGVVVKLIFKHKFKETFLWLLAANAVSIIICVWYVAISQ